MTLLEHLEELRSRLFKVSLAVVGGTIIGYAVFPYVLTVLTLPYCGVVEAINAAGEGAQRSCDLIATNPLEPFSTRIRVSMLIGAFIGGPVIFWQLWRFVAPGLTDKERRYAAPFVFVSQILFGIGIVFAWFVLPNALRVLTSMGGPDITPLLTASEYIKFIVSTSLAFGVVFEMPVVLVFLSLVGVLGSKAMRTARPYAVVGVAIVAALITPTTDPVTMLVMMAPMLVFYEVSILFAMMFERRRRRRDAAADA